jgi:hypothetical protein
MASRYLLPTAEWPKGPALAVLAKNTSRSTYKQKKEFFIGERGDCRKLVGLIIVQSVKIVPICI